MNQTFELKLSDNRVVSWVGADGVQAARRYVDAHPGAVVVAWRPGNRQGVFVGVLDIIEPGDRNDTNT